MTNYVTGDVIRTLRDKKKLTQKQLAALLDVSDKAVSKWETGRGLPDISLLAPLAAALGVSVAELLRGECAVNRNRAANMRRSRLYICPVCGNVLAAAGEGSFSCCGVTLPPLEAETPDEGHGIAVEKLESEYFVRLEHPMEREHFISFLAYVTDDRVELCKLYPEQEAEARFMQRGGGTLLACCSRHGLFAVKAE